ncbi:hypothetical protein H1S01_09615 [Heliobacterium chlorum]|uniref:Uncharacterized protein n=1 Tax=Heliobacterium chlorum TaxID=2698 RepID=A0ABR7T3H8_HELCL|nr:hypothetical protein [Heliobacterium chlorum]MBC9784767.1 hypothetical protein [Heliobacterium chlorum]
MEALSASSWRQYLSMMRLISGVLLLLVASVLFSLKEVLPIISSTWLQYLFYVLMGIFIFMSGFIELSKKKQKAPVNQADELCSILGGNAVFVMMVIFYFSFTD